MPVQPLVIPLLGGRTATLTPAARDFPERVHVRIEGGGAAPFVEASLKLGSSTARRTLATRANITDADADAMVAAVERWLPVVAQTLAADEAAALAAVVDPSTIATPYGVHARLITQPVSESVTYPQIGTIGDMVALLKRPGMVASTVIEWSKDQIERLVVLDVDFHDPTGKRDKPTEKELEWLGEDLSPAPWIWWRTHGGGLKAVYAPIPHTPFTATELAAGAAAQVLVTPFVARCKGTVELITRTRHPMAEHSGKRCGPVHETMPTERFACLQRFSLAGATDEEVEDVLEENGFTIGDRLPHDQCVIDPGHVSMSANPVMVTESGFYCHSCSGRGLGGFTSWGTIRKKLGLATSLADNEVGPINDAVKHFVHFAHVDYLMDVHAPEIPAPYRALLHSALLKNAHGADPRIHSVFSGFGFVRGMDDWLHHDTLKSVGRPLNQADVSVLPSVHVLNEDNEPKVSQISVTTHTNNGELKGWTPIQPNLFVPIFSQFNVPDVFGGHRAALCKPHRLLGGRNHVRYLSPEQRISRDEAEKRIQDYFPGINMTYLKAIILAMGCAESGSGMIPMLWATGPTGSAKTTTIQIVLQMLGEKWESMSEIPEDRLDQIFGEALEETRAIAFDDFAKEPEDYKRLHTFFIRLSRDGHTYHKLRFGKRMVPVNSAIFLTDWRTPAYFVNDPQLGRRIHLIRLQTLAASWEKMGRKVQGWWSRTPAMQEAAETFFSSIVDDFFPEGDSEGFGTKMQRIGVHLVSEETGEDVSEQKVSLRELVYDLVMGICEARVVNPIDERRLGRGYREILWKTQGPIGQACTDMVESLGAVKMTSESLNHVLEQFKGELQSMFGFATHATFQLRDYGSKTFIRVVEEGARSRDGTKKINEELFSVWPVPATHREATLKSHARAAHHMNGHANGYAHPAIITEPVTSFDWKTPPASRVKFDLPQLPGLLSHPVIPRREAP